ncbi:MAG TPA: DUF2891 domain-containing protein [Holophaga sp.]|nr:DUF2891 domain-containing protein [Holophaga sp.]
MTSGHAAGTWKPFTRETAGRFADHVLGSVRREYPNKLDHVMAGPHEVRSPRELHPAFYGCFDWHSAVHGHWMLARCLQAHPGLPREGEIREVFEAHFAPEAVKAETDYFLAPGHRSFERTYGWAWLLKLAGELRSVPGGGPRWAARLQPLADAVVAAFHDFLPRLTYPNRTGVHPNTAFSLGLALDYASAAGDGALGALLADRARAWYGEDRGGPLAWEPGGEDFLSPCLEEAALMAQVLPSAEYRPWLEAFLPDLLAGRTPAPAHVSDRTDPRIVHLDGLNLSRARCLRTVAAALGADPRRGILEAAALDHAGAALPHVLNGNYEGDHWLATFAVHMMEAGQSL